MKPTARRVGGVEVVPGTHQVVRLPVTTRLDGSLLTIACHVVRGAADGPTLAIVGTLHGSQWSSIEAIRRVVLGLEPNKVKGTVLAVPVANPIAFERNSRMTPDDSDLPDLNRVFPGGTTWITEQMAAVITAEVLEGADALINYHTGVWGSCLATVDHLGGITEPSLAASTARLAVAYGYPSIRSLGSFASNTYPGPSAIGAWSATARGIPSIAPNVGGSGFAPEVEEDWNASNVRGLRNLMAHLGMTDGQVELPPRILSSRGRGHRIVPRGAGMLEPLVGVDRLLGPVRRDELLARIVNPHTFEVTEELRSPSEGFLFGVARWHPVWPGDWAYFVADSADPRTRWLESAGTVDATAERLLALDEGRA
jgi:predicted deacylase